MGFELLNKSFESINQSFDFDRVLFSIKLLNKFNSSRNVLFKEFISEMPEVEGYLPPLLSGTL